MKPLYIFDLDGTLALIEHRVHMLQGSDPDRWRHFYAACDRDQPNAPVLATFDRIRRSGAEVWIFSGRTEDVREKTIDWLLQHTGMTRSELEGPLLNMREAGDTTPDDVLKEQWLDSMLIDDRRRLVAAFDDRDRVVAMWRRRGVACFQVAPGGF